jgi:hypothetical protein
VYIESIASLTMSDPDLEPEAGETEVKVL